MEFKKLAKIADQKNYRMTFKVVRNQSANLGKIYHLIIKNQS